MKTEYKILSFAMLGIASIGSAFGVSYLFSSSASLTYFDSDMVESSQEIKKFKEMYPEAKHSIDDDLRMVSYRLDLESNRTEIVSNPYIVLQAFLSKGDNVLQEIRLDCSDGTESRVAVGKYNVATFLDSRLCEKAIPELRSTMYYEFSSDDTIPSGALSSSVDENPDDSDVYLEGFKDTYKTNEPILFTIVLKEGQKCGATKILIVDSSTSEFVNGVGIELSCDSRYLSQDSKFDIPIGDWNMPIKIDQPGHYKILINLEGEYVFEKTFVVRSIIPR